MKKAIIPIILVLCMAGSAHAIFDLSAGVYGGINAPIVQDDAATGTAFGIKAKAAPIPFLAASIFYEWRKFGNPEINVGGVKLQTDGGKVKVYGLNVLLGSPGGSIGPHFYGMAGVFNYKWTRQNFATFTKTGYDIGAGMEIILPMHIGLEGQAKFDYIPTTGGGSRKSGQVYIGANYHFGFGAI